METEKNALNVRCANLKQHEAAMKDKHEIELAKYQDQLLDLKTKNFVLTKGKTNLEEKLKKKYEKEIKYQKQSLEEQFSVDCKAYKKELEENQQKLERLDDQLYDKKEELNEKSRMCKKYKSQIKELQNKFKKIELCMLCDSINSSEPQQRVRNPDEFSSESD